MKKLLFIPLLLFFNFCFSQDDNIVILGNQILTLNWGGITGTLSNQTDLQNALNLKLNISDSLVKYVTPTQLASFVGAGAVKYTDSTIKYLTPTQLGFIGGRIDSSHLPLYSITLTYPLVATSPTTFTFSATYVDSLIALSPTTLAGSTGDLISFSATNTQSNIPSVATGSILISQGVTTKSIYSTAIPNGVTGTTQTVGDNSTKLATDAFANAAAAAGATENYAQLTYALLGGVTKAEPIGADVSNVTTNFTLVNQQINWVVVYLPTAQTITGVKWWQSTAGSYTGNNYNGVALYSYSAGTLTYIDESANTASLWSGANVRSVALGTTHALSAGVYVISSLYCQSAQTTAPTVGAKAGPTGTNVIAWDFTNSAKLYSLLATQTAMPNPTQVFSGLTSIPNEPYFVLY